MTDSDFQQILDAVDFGVLVIAPDTRILHWNRWLSDYSGFKREDVLSKALYELYPDLRSPAFERNLRSVLAFGNFAFFSQKVHGNLIPLPAYPHESLDSPRMQQQCRMGPIRDEKGIRSAFIIVQNVTEVVETEQRLADQAMKDSLTGIFNRRFFALRLDSELERARKKALATSVILLDIDHFKAVNDALGHEAGDKALQQLAKTISPLLRKSDTFARYGGEEFSVLMPDCPLEPALRLAERLRLALEASECLSANGSLIRFTASFGVACAANADNGDALMRRADDALYRAKAEGRNLVRADSL